MKNTKIMTVLLASLLLVACGGKTNSSNAIESTQNSLSTNSTTNSTINSTTNSIINSSISSSSDNNSSSEVVLPNVIVISDVTGFLAISNDLSAHYELANDIDLAGTEWDSGTLGSNLGDFSGSLNGKGYTLKNFSRTSGGFCLALFNIMKPGSIVENLGVTGYVKNAGTWASVICIENRGTIRNCWTSVILSASEAQSHGALLALKNFDTGRIQNCLTFGVNNMTGTFEGLAKSIMVIDSMRVALITDCFALSDNNTFKYSIANCTAFEDPATPTDVHLRTSDEMKQASLYANFDTNIWNIVDGQYPTLKSQNPSTVTPYVHIMNNVTTINASALPDKKLTILGVPLATSLTDIEYSLIEPNDKIEIVGNELIINVTEVTEITVKATIKGTEVYDTKTFTLYPYQVNLISTPADLIAIGTDSISMSGKYILTNDIELVDEWKMLAPSLKFSGTLDGKGYTIKNFHCTTIFHNDGFGIFREIAPTGVVQNLGVTGEVLNAGNWAGVIATVNTGLVRNVWTDVDMYSTSNMGYGGLLVLQNWGNGKIENCLTLGENHCMGTEWSLNRGIMLLEYSSNLIINSYCRSDNNEFIYSIGKDNKETSHMKTLTELKNIELYVNWSPDIWNITEGSVPTLKILA